jgi:dihydrofolate reductase
MPALSAGGCFPDMKPIGLRSAMNQVSPSQCQASATKAELEWSRLAAKTSHYVLSRTLTAAKWANTSFLRDLNAVADLKRQDGKAIYLMGGARVASSLIDAGLLDEIRLIVYPLISGQAKALFGTIATRQGLKLKENKLLGGGRLLLSYLTVEP